MKTKSIQLIIEWINIIYTADCRKCTSKYLDWNSTLHVIAYFADPEDWHLSYKTNSWKHVVIQCRSWNFITPQNLELWHFEDFKYHVVHSCSWSLKFSLHEQIFCILSTPGRIFSPYNSLCTINCIWQSSL